MTMPLAVGMLLERRGKDNERDAATRSLCGGCAALRLQRTLNGRHCASFLVEVEYWLEGGMNDGQDKDGWSANE